MNLTIGQCATMACLLEVTAPKPGNVHRGADFEDLTFDDFAISAVAIAPAMDSAARGGVGAAVLSAVKATHALVGTNTNLGTVLLLAPLAAVSLDVPLASGVGGVLSELTASDSQDVYEAIRLSAAGGLGKVDEMDVHAHPPDNLLDAMRAAAARDLVARQYAENFSQVFEFIVPSLADGCKHGWSLTASIIHTHVRLMSEFPDSLIARKCGIEVAKQSATFASRVLESGKPGDESYEMALAELDFWLRSDGHRRNPGTTADMIAAGLFAGLRDHIIRAK